MSNPNQAVPRFTVNIVEDDETGESTPHWYLDGTDMGAIDWAMSSDERHGFVDYLGQADLIKRQKLGRVALPALAENLHQIYPQLETVDFPPEFHNYQEVFKHAA